MTVTSSAAPGTGTGQDVLAELRTSIGSSSPTQVARHPVNEAMIAHWCDAIGDGNPVYTDPSYATSSPHGGIVAPPAMLDVWGRGGLKHRRAASSPQARAIQAVEKQGFTSVVAVNSELEFRRYVRPGEVIQNVETLEDVSPEKATALGVGHFITTRHRFTTADGEHLGDLLFRILKFRPGSGRTASADGDAGNTAQRRVDDASALRPRPGINRDNQYFWDGTRAHELRIQRCNDCGHLYNPPTPRCWQCGSFSMGYVVASGRGTLYSYAVPHYPVVPGFGDPRLVGLVELEEGTRLVADLTGMRREDLRIGMPLEVGWLDSHPALVEGATDSRGSITIPRFRPAVPARRTDPMTRSELAGLTATQLPLWAVPITPTLIVSGAIATRDFQEVHHDRDLAQQRGSADIFMNINTTVGLMERYVTDWAGPTAQVKALRVRLGAPNYPYDTMTFSGSVTAADPATGQLTVSLQGNNKLGAHATGTVELEIPAGSAQEAGK